jgi:hypothetical protein
MLKVKIKVVWGRIILFWNDVIFVSKLDNK